jgi:16S rRNA (adenine1518-N6/adenine1519-N6)-dimethyltransferase
LKSKQAIVDMIRAADISRGEKVLEIGPGKGVLTEALLEAGAHVITVEADRELIPFLQEKFAEEIEEGKLKLVQGNILDVSPSTSLGTTSYKLVANIPYYITGAIIRKFLEAKNQPKSMTLLVQKEVAERIVARDGKESILSLSVKAYGTPKIVTKVPKRYFSPEPKVDSAIIHIGNISKNNFKGLSEEKFFEIIRTAFAQKRKTLAKNLRIFRLEPPNGLVDPKIRAEDLSLKDFILLAKKLFPQRFKGR